ncbi:MAG: SDR family NAD(P)-dependent oxidoreductase [Caulobacteraceae bacterium]
MIIVTGAAGFIGRFTALSLLERGERVVGVDNFNAYCDPALKEARAEALTAHPDFRMVRMDVADAEAFAGLVRETGARRIVHLAAQAGVRHSIEAPFDYQHANLKAHLSVLEACRHNGVEHLVYASSSSVYGDRPAGGAAFSEADRTDAPASLYAATKLGCELMSTSYSSLYGMAQTGLRFFTVYGPWGRPDMALFGFTEKMLSGQPIEVFGEGRMMRDFTYVDDIVTGVVAALDLPPPAGGNRILNIGAGRPVGLMRMIEVLEESLGVKAEKIMRPMQPGDVSTTFADVSRLKALTGYAPKVMLEDGVPRFVDWYRGYRA